MADRRERRRKGVRGQVNGRIVVAAVLFAAGVWQIGVKGFAAEPRLAPSIAARVDPSNGAVLARFAQSQILRDVAVARDAARRALVQDPLSSRATLVLALAAIDRGDIAGADRLMARAAQLSRRESTANAWMFDLDMTQGRYADAYRNADIMLRREPGLGSQVLPTLVRVSDFPPGLPALAQRLATRPPWRQSFFEAFVGVDEADPTAMLQALQAAGGQPTPPEFGALVGRQIRLGDAEGARRLWQRANGRPLPLVVNGGFEDGLSGGALDWRLDRSAGRAVSVGARADGAGTALRIDPYAVGRPKTVMSQSLLLAPGRYRLGYEGRGEDGEGALNVSLRCVASNAILGQSRDDFGSGWQRAAVEFAVPASGCAVQELRIGTLSGRRSDVPLWIDSVTLSRR